jgi:hypothetical protein
VSLLRALFDLCVALLLPGWLLLRAAGWPRSQPERLLLAGPASIGVIAVAAAVLGRFGLALGTWQILALDAVLAAVVVLRRGGVRDEERLPLWMYAVGLLPGLVLLGVVVAMSGGLSYPPGEDSLVHAATIRWFLDGHPAPAYLPNHLLGVNEAEVRYGWHVFAAALVRGTGLDPGKAVTVGTWAVVTMLPGSLMLFARRAGLGWRGVAVTGIAALGFGLVPFKLVALGQAPLLAGGYVIAPAAAVAWCDALRTRSVGPVALAVILAAGVIFVHPSDLPTLALLVFVLLPVALRGFRRPRWAEVAVLGTGAAALLSLLRLWTGYASKPLGTPAMGTVASDAVSSDAFVNHRHLSGFWDALVGAVTSFPHDWILPGLALVALPLAWRRLPTRVFALLGGLALLIQLDAWGWQVPERVLVAVYPWPSPDRLVALDWYVIPPLAAIAIVALSERLRGPAGPKREGWSVRSGLFATVVAAVAVAPALSFAPGMLEHAHQAQTGLTTADLAAFPTVERIVPPGQLILTDGIADGGGWLSILTGRDTLLHKEWNHVSSAPEVRTALQDLCRPGTSERLRGLGVQWVYLGPKPAASTGYADRSCAAVGTAELRPVSLPDAGPQGPWLLRAAPAGSLAAAPPP